METFLSQQQTKQMTMCPPMLSRSTNSLQQHVLRPRTEMSSSSATPALLPNKHAADDAVQHDEVAHDFPLIEWSDAENDGGVEDHEEEEAANHTPCSKKRQSNEDLFSMMCSPTKRRRRRRSASTPVDLNHIHEKLNVNMKRQNPDGLLLRSLKFACKLDSLATLDELKPNSRRTTTTTASSKSWTSSAFASHFNHHHDQALDIDSNSTKQNYQWPSISTMSAACTTSLPISSSTSVDLFKALEKIENLTISYNDDIVQA